MCCFLLLVYLFLSVTARDVSAEEVDCQVYNHLYVCLGNSVLHSVAFEDVNAVQTIEDIELHLEGLGVQDIAKDAFLEVTNTSALYIRDNQLSKIFKHYFADLDQLTYLDLKNNSIRDIEDGSFANLDSLETLILDYNNMIAFRPGVFKGYRQDETPLPHPCYRSTAMDYGWYAPTIHTVPTSYYPRDNSFSTNQGRGGMYRNCSLNTVLDKSRI